MFGECLRVVKTFLSFSIKTLDTEESNFSFQSLKTFTSLIVVCALTVWHRPTLVQEGHDQRPLDSQRKYTGHTAL